MRSPDVRVLPLPAQTGDLLLAFRVRSVLSGNNIPVETAGSVSFIGQSAAIDNAARLWRAERLARSVPGLLLSAAVAIAALFFLSVPLVTRGATEYFWFGLFVLGSRCFRLLPLYPEGLGIGWMQSFNLAMMTSLLGPTIVYLFCCDPCSSPASTLRPGSARLRCLRSQSWVPSASC